MDNDDTQAKYPNITKIGACAADLDTCTALLNYLRSKGYLTATAPDPTNLLVEYFNIDLPALMKEQEALAAELYEIVEARMGDRTSCG